MKLTLRQSELLTHCANPTTKVVWSRGCHGYQVYGDGYSDRFAGRTGKALFMLGLVSYDNESDQLVATEAGKAEAGRDA